MDVTRESAMCSDKAWEKDQDQCGGMCLECPQQLPTPAAPKAAHFTPQAAAGPGLEVPSYPSTHLAAPRAGAKSQSHW